MRPPLNIVICIVIGSSLLFHACSDDNPANPPPSEPVDTSTFIYPIGIGSTWSYSTYFTVSNIRPDSIGHYFSHYPVSGSGSINVLYDTTIGIYTARCFFETYNEGTVTYSSRFYFLNNDTALICPGYRQHNFQSFNPYIVKYRMSFRFQGRSFSELRDILAYYNEFTNSGSDSLIIEDPPVECLKYPVLKGTQWVFKNIIGGPVIYKKYINFENVTVDTQKIGCVRTQRIRTGTSDLVLFDFYSRFGQLKKDYTVKNAEVRNPQGFPIGFVDYNYLYTVTSYNLTE
jgi:hypothetical protein